MDRLVERCAGLDVHKDTVTATVRMPGAARDERHQETQTFATTTKGLLVLLDWLQSHRVTLVGMESTGVYWRPAFYALEGHFECWLLNAQHLRNVPGRKTDVADSVTRNSALITSSVVIQMSSAPRDSSASWNSSVTRLCSSRPRERSSSVTRDRSFSP
jgi:hypothetical protein